MSQDSATNLMSSGPFNHHIYRNYAFSSTLMLKRTIGFLNDAPLPLDMSNTKGISFIKRELLRHSDSEGGNILWGKQFVIWHTETERMEGRGRGISSFLRLLPEYANESLISQHQNTAVWPPGSTEQTFAPFVQAQCERRKISRFHW